jgi:hypothetical protein
MVEDTQSADYEETDNPYRDLSQGACCLGELLIRAEVKLTYSPYRKEVDYEAVVKRETSTKCVAYGCHTITTGELSPYGPFQTNVCEAIANGDNQPYEGGGKQITVYKNGRTLDPMGLVRPADDGPYLDDEGHIRYRHTVSLGCCDYGCAAQFWDGGSMIIFGSVPGKPVRIRRRIGVDLDPTGTPWRPTFIIEEGLGFGRDTWKKVADAILDKFGPGGQYPYKFKPCCKKGSSGGDSGDSGGGKG